MTQEAIKTPLLDVRAVKKYFPVNSGMGRAAQQLKAVDDISFTVQRGETVGIVGESGCGKSTLGRLLLRLLEPTAGTVWFDGTDLTTLRPAAMRRMRRRFQMVFQDPQSSLNPRMKVRGILEEPLRAHGVRGAERTRRVRELVDAVGLPSGALQRYAHEFSGGQRQRIGLARALALQPDFIVADEPVAALDVSVQAQVLNLMMDLKKEFVLTYLFIAHDLSVVEYVSDRVGVMYLGQLVEWADAETLYREPLHPYTQSLLAAVPVPDPEEQRETTPVRGDMPNPMEPPAGCRFHTRCPLAEDRCRREPPRFREIRDGHRVACHLAR